MPKSLHILPLYSAMPSAKQMRVFEAIPPNARLVVVATNVAETSLTIPGVSYVVDCGRAKERVYDQRSGISSFEVDWISKASADQRAGRAGRMGPGHCYRLFSSAVYNDYFPLFGEPEVNRIPVDGVVLQMKSMGIDKVVTFPFPTPPDQASLGAALKSLVHLGALDAADKPHHRITDLGRTMSHFPVAPRFAKMLILGRQGGCLPFVVAMVAALAVDNPFRRKGQAKSQEEEEEEADDSAKTKEGDDDKEERGGGAVISPVWVQEMSDVLTILRAVGAYEYSGPSTTFCRKHSLNEKVMKEIHMLRVQLTNIIDDLSGDDQDDLAEIEIQLSKRKTGPNKSSFDPRMNPPTKKQELLLRQIITAGLIDRVAKYSTDAPEAGRGSWRKHQAYECMSTREHVYIHPTSVVKRRAPLPEFVVFHEIVESTRPYMKVVTAIHPSWLPAVSGSDLCSLEDILESPPPKYDTTADRMVCFVNPMFGNRRWSLPAQQVDYKKAILDKSGAVDEDADRGEVLVDLYKWFARLVLEGAVVTKLKDNLVYMSVKPSLATNPKMRSLPRVNAIINVLMRSKVCTRSALVQKWEKDPKYLLPEYLLWVSDQHHRTVKASWPPM
eukprot:TRINITY_DN914_c1_g1_i2.p1 TRINITY_DN914_c1_g1~~TRINITY_DN914_c1_g1_i2.p1  ORF type:complete len:612 (-),score=136.78 TRINITY_DN914_c1_g1_i2:2-1837(-)